jgi:hypothetical protein
VTDPVPGAGALPARRCRLIDTDALTAVVVEIDATREPHALAVLQAGLHDPPAGHRLVFGYDVVAAGLGAWVGDRRVRISIWPALLDEQGTVTEAVAVGGGWTEDDVVTIDIDPTRHGDALADLVRVGRLVVAGPDAGPLPLVVDLDRDLVADVVRAATTPA